MTEKFEVIAYCVASGDCEEIEGEVGVHNFTPY